jgi:hypothetical protein
MDVVFSEIRATTPTELEKALNEAAQDYKGHVPYGFNLHGLLLVDRVRVSASFQTFKQRLVTYSILSNTEYYDSRIPDDGINATIRDDDH